MYICSNEYKHELLLYWNYNVWKRKITFSSMVIWPAQYLNNQSNQEILYVENKRIQSNNLRK